MAQFKKYKYVARPARGPGRKRSIHRKLKKRRVGTNRHPV